MENNTAIAKRANTLPVGVRAKRALEVFANTGSGLSALNSFVFPSSISVDGQTTYGAGWLSVAPRDFPYQNINAYTSSIVMACINWITGGFREAPPVVKRITDTGTESLPNHRLIRFLRRPNPYYNFTKLMIPTLISYYLDGNGYWFKERADGGSGATRAVYYIPHYQIIPKAEDGNYISYYEYNVNGKSYRIPRERIVHFRNELDPYNPLSGRKILDPVLSEIFTDEEAARFIAALVRNTGIPGVVIMPDTEKVDVKPEDAEDIKENYLRKFGGDNRGMPLVLNFAAKIAQMGFNPEQLQFKETRRLPEERVAAQFRIAPVVAGLGAGLDKSTYSNYEQAERHSYQSCLIPAWDEISDEIETQLLPEFTTGNKDYTFTFDYSRVRALQESQDAIVTRTTRLFTSDIILRAEARETNGYEVDETRDNVFFSEIRQKQQALTNGNGAPANVAKGLRESARLLLKAGEPDANLNSALELYQEASVKDAVDGFEGDLEKLFRDLAEKAEDEAKAGLDRYSPAKESERITQEIFKTLGVALLIRALWGRMGKSLERDTVESVSLRLSVTIDFWDEDSAANAKSVLVDLAKSYETSLTEQTKRAIQVAIEKAEDGASVAQIGKAIRANVTGKEMYPGVFDEAYKNAKEAGATDEQALRAGEAKARRYRSKVIAETESRTYQNQVTLEGYLKSGLDKVKVSDGDGCGWKNHNDTDKAHNTTRGITDAKKHSLAHPQCKRRFYPAK